MSKPAVPGPAPIASSNAIGDAASRSTAQTSGVPSASGGPNWSVTGANASNVSDGDAAAQLGQSGTSSSSSTPSASGGPNGSTSAVSDGKAAQQLGKYDGSASQSAGSVRSHPPASSGTPSASGGPNAAAGPSSVDDGHAAAQLNKYGDGGSSGSPVDTDITLRKHGRIALIVIDRPSATNAFAPEHWQLLTHRLDQAAQDPDVSITVLSGTGKFFSAGADVKAATEHFERGAQAPPIEARAIYMQRLAANNADVARAFYEHRPILVAALNGPAVGLSAALLGLVDFIYAVDTAWLLTPFTAMGLVAEGLASQTFPQRLGPKLAHEALIMSRKIEAHELVAAGFISKTFPQTDASTFHSAVLKHLEESTSHLNAEAMLKTKELIRAAQPSTDFHAANLREIVAGTARLLDGAPQRAFAALANKTMRHKL